MFDVENKKVLFITTKNLDYLRNVQELELLRSESAQVDIIGYYDKSYIKRMLKVYVKLLFTSVKKYDVLFIGFAPQLILPIFFFKTFKKRVVMDFFISVYDTMIFDRKRFKEVDYALILTFMIFFVFSGNIARVSVIKEFISKLVVNNTMLAGIVSCQFISNVPTAIFLSRFTINYRELLIAVNIGSLGILISSLASLITLKEFLKHQPKSFFKYLGLFTLFNTIFLVVLLIVTNIRLC